MRDQGGGRMPGQQETSGFLERVDEVLSGVTRWLDDPAGSDPTRTAASDATDGAASDDEPAERSNPIRHWRWE